MDAWLQSLAKVLGIYVLFLVLERVRPAEPRQSMRSVWFNVQWWVLYSAVTALLMGFVFGSIGPWVRAHTGGPLLSLAQPGGTLGLVGSSLLFYLVFDFFYYWFHRAQHRFGLLWRQHRLHHTERALNVTTTQRHHWLEEPLRVFFISLPMVLLIDVPRAHAGALGFAFTLWGFFIHSNLRLRLGPLTPVFVGPQLHRIHHSILPQHQDKNFGAFFPVWDVLFGTYHRPAPEEFPATGIEGVEPPQGLLEAALDPFVGWLPQRRPEQRSVA